MRYQVPQFIEVEDKIFGPLSFRQFAYLAGAAGFCVIVYNFFGFFLTVLMGGPFVLLAVLLAFYKPNNRPFSETLRAMVSYAMARKLYLWAHSRQKRAAKAALPEAAEKPFVPKTTQNRLKNLAWRLDVKEEMRGDSSRSAT